MDREEAGTLRIPEKLILNVKEASEYSGIGTNTIYRLLSNPDCPFLLYVGKSKRIKRQAFEDFVNGSTFID